MLRASQPLVVYGVAWWGIPGANVLTGLLIHWAIDDRGRFLTRVARPPRPKVRAVQ
jgi:hypothetical protein